MHKTYEAILDGDHVRWVTGQPSSGRHRVLVTVLDRERPSSDEIRQILDETRGAWGTNTSQEEIDAAIDAMREEWERA
jgi:hypothetical protein